MCLTGVVAMVAVSCVAVGAKAPAVVRVVRYCDRLFIRSPFSAQEDLVLRLGKGTNRQVNFTGARLVPASAGMGEKELTTGRLIHANGDDSTPWQINGTYIGANHGCSDVRELTCRAHGRTTADLGRRWRDSAGAVFYLIQVVDADRLWFLAPNTGTGDIWRFRKAIAGSRLTGPARGDALTFTRNRMAQLRPACRIRKQQVLVNGTTPLRDGVPVSGAYLDVVDDYDIINPAALLRDLVAHPGQRRDFTADHLDAVIGNHIVYRFYPNGANVIEHTAKALQPFRLGYMGFLQSAKLHRGRYDTHEYYIPKTRPFTQDRIRYDFRSIQDYTSRVPSPLRFKAANKNIEDATNLPDRFIQFLGRRRHGKIEREVGYALGYSLIHGLSTPGVRARNASSALMLYTSSKSYPVAVDAKMGPVIPAGTEFRCVGYRQYFRPETAGGATCLYWHAEADDTVVYADYHRAVTRGVLTLPAAFTGKTLTIVEKTPSVTLHTRRIVPAQGLVVSVAGSYGTVVLKLR